MRFLVLGCNGMAGHTISLYLKEKAHDVIGFDLIDTCYCKTIIGDARDIEKVRSIILEGQFDSVINCIGILNQFAESNKELAAFLNAYFPHFLASITKDTKTQVIHMSTDCVFSGKHGGYTEEDVRDGATFYDRSKALGELEDNKNITLRNSIVGPDLNQNGIGLFNWFMQQRDSVQGFTQAMWTGLTTLELAKVIEAAANQRAHGLYNMVNKDAISKYELLKLFNHFMRNDSVEIVSSDALIIDKSLIRTRFEFDYSVPDYKSMVQELAEWIYAHKEMYPHYE